MTVFRPEFIDALALLAQACDALKARGYSRPIVVGGAAVEFYTGGAIMSGDVDFVTEWQREFEAELLTKGFLRENRYGYVLRGLYHPSLGIAVEVVSGGFFDGRADQNKVRLVEIREGNKIPIAAIEDLIADRLGQYVSNRMGMDDRRQQAIMLYRLAHQPDEAYLDRRIREDTLDELCLANLKDMVS